VSVCEERKKKMVECSSCVFAFFATIFTGKRGKCLIQKLNQPSIDCIYNLYI